MNRKNNVIYKRFRPIEDSFPSSREKTEELREQFEKIRKKGEERKKKNSNHKN